MIVGARTWRVNVQASPVGLELQASDNTVVTRRDPGYASAIFQAKVLQAERPGMLAPTQRPQFETESITLSDGWRGRVLTSYRHAAQDQEASRRLPGPEEWRNPLNELAGDATSLPGYSSLKYSQGGEVFRAHLEVGGETIDIIAKQSRPRGTGRRFANMFRPSRARRNFRRGLELLRAGINTALPLVQLERGALHREAWLITEFVPDLVDLDRVASQVLPRLEGVYAYRVKTAIVDGVVDLLVRMEAAGLNHRDLKASNILLAGVTDGSPLSVWLVDLDGLRRHRVTAMSRQWHPIRRLAASLLDYTTITRTDYCRFLRAYLTRKGLPRTLWKQRYRKLSAHAGHYLRDAARRKTHKLDGYTGD